MASELGDEQGVRPGRSSPSRTASTRRERQAARRARTRRRRWMGAVAALGVVAIAAGVVASRGGGSPGAPGVGSAAPDGSFSTAGATRTVSSLRGRPTLLWYVSTRCSSCQAGTQAMASEIGSFARLHVRVVELELADDLGQPGPGIDSFAHQLAGPAAANPDWTFGVASAGLTTTYDPASDLDIYYLLDAGGHIRYVNSSPASTMNDLLSHAHQLT